MAKRVVAFEFEEIEGVINIIGIRCDGTETDPVPVPPSKAMIGAVVPTAIASASLPGHLLPCDGSQHLREDYPDLYALLDAAFIVDADNFVTPDLRGITVIGTGLYNPGGINYAVNDLVGARRHTLTESEMPAHTHVQNAHTHVQDSHNHIQQAHTHVQNSHGHTGNSHGHSINDPGHAHTIAHTHNLTGRQNSAIGTGDFMRSNNSGASSGTVSAGSNSPNSGSNTTGISVDNSVISVQDATATNQNATAVNNAATAVNQNTTATNQNTGGGQPHNNMQPSRALNYAIVAKAA